MDGNPEFGKLTALCRELGADPEQARTMAAQLLKRAEQLAGERGISRSEAMEYLLKVVVSGRRGEVFTGNAPREAEKWEEKRENPHNEAD